jgi:importin-4
MCASSSKTNNVIDQANEPTVQQMTPTLMPIFEKVLGPPEEQLEDETRSQLVELVKYLHK